MTWFDLSGSFAYGSKLTAIQMSGLRDNIAAIANGDSGAPGIQTVALSDAIITSDKMQPSSKSITSDKIAASVIEPINLADSAITQRSIESEIYAVTNSLEGDSTTSTSYVDTDITTYIYNDGTRDIIYFAIDMLTTGSTAYCKILAGSSYGDEVTTTSTSYQTKTGEIDISGEGVGWLKLTAYLKASSSQTAAIRRMLCYF